jgi:hypothetical protein
MYTPILDHNNDFGQILRTTTNIKHLVIKNDSSILFHHSPIRWIFIFKSYMR